MADPEDTALVASTEEETDLDIFEEMGIDSNQVDKEVAKLSTEKVELDTYGLDLDLLSEEEPEEEPAADLLEEEEEEEVEEEVEEEEEVKPKRSKWLLPALGGGGLLVLAGAAALWFFVFKPGPPPPAPKVAQQQAKSKVIVTQRPIGKPSLDLREFIVPRKSEKETVLRISLFLVFASEQARTRASERLIELRNAIYQRLLDEAGADLRSDEAKLALQDDIAEAVNRALGREWVTGVYFTGFLII